MCSSRFVHSVVHSIAILMCLRWFVQIMLINAHTHARTIVLETETGIEYSTHHLILIAKCGCIKCIALIVLNVLNNHDLYDITVLTANVRNHLGVCTHLNICNAHYSIYSWRKRPNTKQFRF